MCIFSLTNDPVIDDVRSHICLIKYKTFFRKKVYFLNPFRAVFTTELSKLGLSEYVSSSILSASGCEKNFWNSSSRSIWAFCMKSRVFEIWVGVCSIILVKTGLFRRYWGYFCSVVLSFINKCILSVNIAWIPNDCEVSQCLIMVTTICVKIISYGYNDGLSKSHGCYTNRWMTLLNLNTLCVFAQYNDEGATIILFFPGCK